MDYSGRYQTENSGSGAALGSDGRPASDGDTAPVQTGTIFGHSHAACVSASSARAAALADPDVATGPKASQLVSSEVSNVNQRRAPRITMLIRSAKLITKQGEFVCVVRDVSRTGVRVRLFHSSPDEPHMCLQMPTGNSYELKTVRRTENEAAFEFAEPIDVEQLITEASDFPKRAPRFGLFFPITVSALGSAERWDGVVENISQQGARFECEGLFAINQTIQLKGDEGAEALTAIQAKVRWRRDNSYGVVFDNTFSLTDFAVLCARLQSPMLLPG